jgi:hypothetical protein
MGKRALAIRERDGRTCIRSVVTKRNMREVSFLPVDFARSHSVEKRRIIAMLDFPFNRNLRICSPSGSVESLHPLYGRSDSVAMNPFAMLHVCEVVAPKDDDAVLDVCTLCAEPMPMTHRVRDWRGFCFSCHTFRVVVERPTPRALP